MHMLRHPSPLFTAIFLAVVLTSCVALSYYPEPIKNTALRPVLLGFGRYVTPDSVSNPINPPERFTGYHVGADFEVTNDELTTDVRVYAICAGDVAYSGFAEGYGGLLIQRCEFNGSPITVLYGHLSLKDLPAKASFLQAGKQIGKLAPARSTDSDGNRKHLHLGIRRGKEIDFRGYVQTSGDIVSYIDPLNAFPPRLAGTGGLLKAYWQQ